MILIKTIQNPLMKLDGIEHIKFNDVLKTPNELLSNTIPISFTASIDKWSLGKS